MKSRKESILYSIRLKLDQNKYFRVLEWKLGQNP